TVFHLGLSETRPPPCRCLRQVQERAFVDFKWFELLKQLRARCSRKPFTSTSHVHQLSVLIIANNQCVKISPGGRVAANAKFLALVHAHLLPGAGPLSSLIAATAALRNQSFKTPLFD